KDTVELAAVDGELYADQKIKGLRMPLGEPGTVFAWEHERRERPQWLQASWDFQRGDPVQTARLTVVLPAGWTHEERWFHAAPAEPRASRDGATGRVTSRGALSAQSTAWAATAGGARAGEARPPPPRRIARWRGGWPSTSSRRRRSS